MAPDLLADGLASLGLVSSPQQQSQLNHYVDLLDKWNAVYNLTAIRGRDRLLAYHVLDSLSIAPWMPPAHGVCLDVGTGAGLPGIPLAVLRPDLHWVLLDGNGKKTRFVQQVVAELGLPQVEVVQSRVEDYHPAFEFDAIVSRAYASLAVFQSSVRHLCGPHTRLMSMKTLLDDSEANALDHSKLDLQSIPLQVPGIAEPRSLIILNRTEHE